MAKAKPQEVIVYDKRGCTQCPVCKAKDKRSWPGDVRVEKGPDENGMRRMFCVRCETRFKAFDAEAGELQKSAIAREKVARLLFLKTEYAHAQKMLGMMQEAAKISEARLKKATEDFACVQKSLKEAMGEEKV